MAFASNRDRLAARPANSASGPCGVSLGIESVSIIGVTWLVFWARWQGDHEGGPGATGGPGGLQPGSRSDERSARVSAVAPLAAAPPRLRATWATRTTLRRS